MLLRLLLRRKNTMLFYYNISKLYHFTIYSKHRINEANSNAVLCTKYHIFVGESFATIRFDL